MELLHGSPADMSGRSDREIRTYQFLDRLGIEFDRTDHPDQPATSMEVCADVDAILNVHICKNLFLCNRQKTNFYLLVMPGDKPFKTKELSKQMGIKRNMKQIITEFLKTEPYFISAMSNISAVIMDQMPDLNWAGFYLVREGQLVVGPFQGKPACIHIARGRGVCGTCLDRDKTIVVPDVHKFPGHIACDSASNSEIVIPIHKDGEVAAVLDIDSPVPDRFSEDDRALLEGVVEAMEKMLEW